MTVSSIWGTFIAADRCSVSRNAQATVLELHSLRSWRSPTRCLCTPFTESSRFTLLLVVRCASGCGLGGDARFDGGACFAVRSGRLLDFQVADIVREGPSSGLRAEETTRAVTGVELELILRMSMARLT